MINTYNTITNLKTFEGIPALGSLEAYINWTNRLPQLSAEEEKELAVRFKKHNDLEAARFLVLSHLRFVVRIAQGYAGYGLPHGDLIQEGNIGLMKAVKRFDPDLGVKLISFAVHWIKAEITEFILRNWRIVKVATTKAQRKLFFNLRKSAKKLGWFNNEEVQDLAKNLKVKPNEVRTMEARLRNGSDVAFNARADGDSDYADIDSAPENYLADDAANPATLFYEVDTEQGRVTSLRRALKNLDARSRDILEQRWFKDNKATLHELAAHYHISAERVRQIETEALEKIKKFINIKRVN